MSAFSDARISLDSIDLSSYRQDPFGTSGEAYLYLLDLTAQGSGTVSDAMRRIPSVVATVRRAMLKVAGISFETARYSADRDADGKRVKTYDPPANRRMGAVFAQADKDGLLGFTFEGLRTDDSDVSEDSRRVFTVTVK